MRMTLAFAAMLAAAGACIAQPYAEWGRYKSVAIDTRGTGAGVASTVTNFPVLIRLNASNAADIFAGPDAALPEGADIRISNGDGTAAVPFEIEHWDAAAQEAAIWALAGSVPGDDSVNVFRIYWKKADAVSASSGSSVFTTDNGYQAVFHFAETDNGNVTDVTSNAIVGTNNGSTSTDTAVIGRARRFNNPNNADAGAQYINLGNPASLNFGGRTTYSAWVRWIHIRPKEGTNFHYRTVVYRHGPGGDESFLRISTDNTANERYVTGRWASSSFTNIVALDPQWANDRGDSAQWVHLTGVYDSTATNSRIWRLYRNGVQIAASSHNNNAGPPTGATQWWIGRSTPTPRYWDGQIDELRISSTNRSAAYIKLSYETQKPGATAVVLGETQGGDGTLLRAAHPAARYDFSARTQGAGALFRIAESANATVTVSDVRGQVVWKGAFASGARELAWNGENAANGLYVARLSVVDKQGRIASAERRLTLAR